MAQHTGRKLTGLIITLACVASASFSSTIPQRLCRRRLLSWRRFRRRACNSAREPEQREGKAFFADGVQDEILTDLARIADLKVISRTSVIQYRAGQTHLREIGQQLASLISRRRVQRPAEKCG